MSMEKAVIGRTISYLITRDIWLILLLCGHILVYYNLFPSLNPVILSVLGIGALLWILFFTRLLKLVFAAKKDKYLVNAFSDEYFRNIREKAGYHAYISMCTLCLILIFVFILLEGISINIDIPLFIACETVFLLGVITDDISKIFLSRG